MYKYKNISDQELTVVGFGMVAPGKILETNVLIYNSNLQLLVDDERKIGVDPVTKPKRK